jgi:hypothetical protein
MKYLSFIRNERGAAMLVALSLIFMMALIGVSAIKTTSVDMSISDNYRQDARSFYIAEAGLEHACSVLRDSSGWREGLAGVPFGGGTYSVRILDSDSNAALGDSVMIMSIGHRSGAQSTVSVKLSPNNPFRWAAFADTSMSLGGTTLTDSYDSDSGTYGSTKKNDGGDVGSNWEVDIYGTADIYGDASTADPGNLSITGSAQVFGDTTSTASHIDLPSVSAAEIAQAKAVNMATTGITGNYSYNASTGAFSVGSNKTAKLASGTYWFGATDLKGKLELQPGASVKIYVTGDISMNAQGRINEGGKPVNMQFFCTSNNFSLNGGAEIRAVFYAPDTKFKFNGGANLYGAYIMKEADVNGGSNFHYDRSLRDLTYGTGMNRVAWKEY